MVRFPACYFHYRLLGLCKSGFLLFEYSLEFRIVSTEINYRLIHNKPIAGSSFKFVVYNGGRDEKRKRMGPI